MLKVYVYIFSQTGLVSSEFKSTLKRKQYNLASSYRLNSTTNVLLQEEIYLACKFLYAGTCIKEHASSRSKVVVVLCRLFF